MNEPTLAEMRRAGGIGGREAMSEPTLDEMKKAVRFYEDNLTVSLRFHHLTPEQKRRLAALRAVLRLLEQMEDDGR